jgi:O-antigen ligase
VTERGLPDFDTANPDLGRDSPSGGAVALAEQRAADAAVGPRRLDPATILLGCVIVWMSLPQGSTATWSANLLYLLDLLVLAVACHVARQGPWPRLPALHAAFAVLAAVAAGGLLRDGAPFPQATLDALLEVLGAWALCWAACLVGLSPAASRRIVACVLAACVAQATFGVMMVLTGIEHGAFGPKLEFVGVATGTLVNRNHFAAFLAVGAALGIGWLVGHMRGTSRSWREFGRGALDALLGEKGRVRLVLVVLVIGIVESRSRMGNVAFVVALSLAAGAYLLARRFAVSRTFIVLLVSFALVDAVLVGSFFGLDQVAERLGQTSLAGEQRDEVVRDAQGLIAARPWLGWGAGTFRYVYPGVRGEDILTSTSAAHNDYVEALVEVGMVGLAAYLWLGGLLAVAAWRAMRRGDAQARAIGFAGFMAVSYTALHALVEFNGQIPAFTHLLAVVLGFTCAAAARAAGVGEQARRRWSPPHVA